MAVEGPSHSVFLIFCVIGAFFSLVFLGVAGLAYYYMNNVLGEINADIGQVNFQDANNATFGKIATSFLNNIDNIGLGMLIGMSLFMIIGGFFLGNNGKGWMAFDIVIIVICFIASIYIAQAYNTLLQSEVLGEFYADYLPKSSAWVLNLPEITATVGALMMIITYGALKKKKEGLDVAYGY